ncbi:MAG: hypothetical protein PUC97_04335 [bacterium]|nr:hypothetical protein [bacterium]
MKVGLTAMGLMALLSGCSGRRTATLHVTSYFSSDMVFAGEDKTAEDASKEEVSPETYTVKKGDTFSDFTITKVTADSVSIRSEYAEYYTDLRKDGALLESLGIANEFTLKPGETLVLTDAGLCDATHTVYIDCVSID